MPRCGRPTRNGSQCRQPAGIRTTHPGDGACYLHGGCGGQIKHGLYSKYRPTKVMLRAEDLVGDPRILDIERQIAVAQALQERVLEKAGDEPDAEAVDMCLKVIRQVSNDIKSYWDLMLKREETIPKSVLIEILKLTFVIVRKHIEDEEAVRHIRRDVARQIAPGLPEQFGDGDPGQ